MEVAPCLAAFCLRQNFGGFCRGLKGMQASPPRPRAKPTGISAHALKFCPRQEVKAFDLRAKFTDRANLLRRLYANLQEDPFTGRLLFEKRHFYCEMTAQIEAPSGRELSRERLREPAALSIYDCKRLVCLYKKFYVALSFSLSSPLGRKSSSLPEGASVRAVIIQ